MAVVEEAIWLTGYPLQCTLPIACFALYIAGDTLTLQQSQAHDALTDYVTTEKQPHENRQTEAD